MSGAYVAKPALLSDPSVADPSLGCNLNCPLPSRYVPVYSRDVMDYVKLWILHTYGSNRLIQAESYYTFLSVYGLN